MARCAGREDKLARAVKQAGMSEVAYRSLDIVGRVRSVRRLGELPQQLIHRDVLALADEELKHDCLHREVVGTLIPFVHHTRPLATAFGCGVVLEDRRELSQLAAVAVGEGCRRRQVGLARDAAHEMLV